MITILPLNKKVLKEAGKLADEIFQENDVSPSIGLTASLDDQVRIKINRENEMQFNWFKYWYAIDEVSEDIVGIIGLYEEQSDSIDACWLGWYTVKNEYRGKGIGSKLLKHAILEAKTLRKKYLRVYTSDDVSRITAQELYKSFGFKPMKELPNNAEDDQLYFELKLY